MWEILERFSPGQLIGLVATVGGILGWIITAVAAQWRKVRMAEIEAALKQQMLDRGMKTEEIVSVLRLKKSDSGRCGADAARSSALAKAKLVEVLTENGYEAKDIEQILHAFGSHQEFEVIAEREGGERAEAFGKVLEAKARMVKTMAENGEEGEDIVRVLNTFKADAEWRARDHEGVVARV